LRTVTSVSTSGFSNPHFVVAGITTSGEAVAWERSSNGSWTFRNLSEDTQSPLIASDNAVFQITFTDNTIGPFAQLPGLAIAGKTGGGDIVIYQIFNGPDTFGLVQWMFTNITAAGLAPFGETTPDWVGPVTGYGTRWGGLNIAGHDAAGHVWVVWTSADQPHWFQNDLTDNSGGPATTGPISVTVTPWNTIHIHTLDSAGNLIVTWWSPTFGAHWEFNNLTAEIGGPALTPAAGVLSFLGIDNSLNVAAADGSGNIRIYWWRPDSFMWQAGNTTPDLDPADRPTTLSSASVAPESDPSHMVQFGAAQNIFGRTAGDHFVRLHWNNFGPDIWSFEDITAAEMVLPT
jgi:hypothetical protein